MNGWSLFALLALSSLFVPNARGIPLSDFYPYGLAAGDNSVGPTDDGSSGITTLRKFFPFYGKNFLKVMMPELPSSVGPTESSPAARP